MRIHTIIIALAVIAACGPPTPMDWSGYHPSVKERIDALAAARDCAGLQREHDVAWQNDDAQRARTGRGTADLMDYIDDKMRAAGCYR